MPPLVDYSSSDESEPISNNHCASSIPTPPNGVAVVDVPPNAENNTALVDYTSFSDKSGPIYSPGSSSIQKSPSVVVAPAVLSNTQVPTAVVFDVGSGAMDVDEAKTADTATSETQNTADSASSLDFWDDLQLPDLPDVSSQLLKVDFHYLIDSARDLESAQETNVTQEAGTMAERFPEEFTLHPNVYPFSWMILNPGQVPNVPFPWAPKPDTRFNVTGELEMEEAIRAHAKTPEQYYFLATAFNCIMICRGLRLISEQAASSTISRLFDRFLPLWMVYRKHFIPREFRFIRFSDKGQANGMLKDLWTRLRQGVDKREYMFLLEKILDYLHRKPRTDGRLVYSRSKREVTKETYADDGLGLSKVFMQRRGETWPFDHVSVEAADKVGLQNICAPVFR